MWREAGKEKWRAELEGLSSWSIYIYIHVCMCVCIYLYIYVYIAVVQSALKTRVLLQGNVIPGQ